MAKTKPEITVDTETVARTVENVPTASVDSDERFLDMIRDHIRMGTATEADLAEWKRRLGK